MIGRLRPGAVPPLWLGAALLVAAGAALALVPVGALPGGDADSRLGGLEPRSAFPTAELVHSWTWTLVVTPALAVSLATALWTRARGRRRVAGWMLTACTMLALYWLCPTLFALVTDPVTATIVLVIGTWSWKAVLALLQCCAASAAGVVLGRPPARVPTALVLLVTAAMIPLTAPLPAAASAWGVTGFAIWMVALLIIPISLWIGARRTMGNERRALARLALGSLLPVLVVLLCGAFATIALVGARLEINGLALGFGLALPATLIWIAATVHEAAGIGSRVTAIGPVVRTLLWTVWFVTAFQAAIALAHLSGGGASAGALIATVTLTASVVPWRILVGACVRLVDPASAVAAAVIEADRPGRSDAHDRGGRAAVAAATAWISHPTGHRNRHRCSHRCAHASSGPIVSGPIRIRAPGTHPIRPAIRGVLMSTRRSPLPVWARNLHRWLSLAFIATAAAALLLPLVPGTAPIVDASATVAIVLLVLLILTGGWTGAHHYWRRFRRGARAAQPTQAKPTQAP